MKEKPPIGLQPRAIHDGTVRANRIHAIQEATKNYIEAKKDIPVEWIHELFELMDKT